MRRMFVIDSNFIEATVAQTSVYPELRGQSVLIQRYSFWGTPFLETGEDDGKAFVIGPKPDCLRYRVHFDDLEPV